MDGAQSRCEHLVMLLAVLIASSLSLVSPGQAASELRVRVALIDPAGRDVTKEAGVPGREVELVTWIRDVHDLETLRSTLGVQVPLARPDSIARHVALARPRGERLQIPAAESLLASGWLFSGDTCPSITIYPGEIGERVLPLRVSRARSVELTISLPTGFRDEDLFRVWGASVVDQGEPRSFEYWSQDPAAARHPPRQTLNVPEGRHSLWAVASMVDRRSPPLWAHEELVVDSSGKQRLTMNFRVGVEVHGRIVDPKGSPVGSGRGLLLTPRELSSSWSHPGGGGIQSSSLWSATSASDGSFVLRGLPPGREVFCAESLSPIVRVPEAGGDIGDLVLDHL